jgi:hypothetical protein
MTRHEVSTIGEERETADAVRVRRSGLPDEVRAQLDRLQARAMCEECGWQPAVRLQRSRLLCLSCGDVEHAVRHVEAIKLRLDRKK